MAQQSINVNEENLVRLLVQEYKQRQHRELNASYVPGADTVDVLQFLDHELPFCDRSQPTAHVLSKQQEKLFKASTSVHLRHTCQPRIKSTLNYLHKQQERFQTRLTKDIQATHRISELKRKRFERTVVKSSLRDWKHSQARSKRYFKDFEGDLKCQLQQLNTAEEQAFCKAFHQVHGMVKSDTRELEKDMRMKENEKIRLLHENAAGLEKMYQVALATPTIANTAPTPHNPILSKDHIRLLTQVRENMKCLEEHVQDADNRSHHRLLHSNLLACQIPKPILKQRMLEH